MGRSSEMISLCQRARQRLYFRQSHRSSDLQLEQVLLASLGLVPEQILVWLFWVSKRILYVMKLHRSVWLSLSSQLPARNSQNEDLSPSAIWAMLKCSEHKRASQILRIRN